MAVGRESLLPSWDLPVCRAICEEKDAQWYGAIEVKWIVKAGRICVASPWRAELPALKLQTDPLPKRGPVYVNLRGRNYNNDRSHRTEDRAARPAG